MPTSAIMRLIQVAAVVVLAASDSQAQCRAPDATPAQWAERTRVLEFGYWLGGTRAQLLERFGQPTSVRADTMRWFGGSAPDSAFRWTYPRFAVSIAKSTEGGGEVASGVTLLATVDSAPSVLALGTIDTLSVVARLGPPTLREQVGDTLVLCFQLSNEGAEEEAFLSFIRGILARVRWALYVG